MYSYNISAKKICPLGAECVLCARCMLGTLRESWLPPGPPSEVAATTVLIIQLMKLRLGQTKRCAQFIDWSLLTILHGESKNPQILKSRGLFRTLLSSILQCWAFKHQAGQNRCGTCPHLLPRAGLPFAASLTNGGPHAACTPLERRGSLPFGV